MSCPMGPEGMLSLKVTAAECVRVRVCSLGVHHGCASGAEALMPDFWGFIQHHLRLCP